METVKMSDRVAELLEEANLGESLEQLEVLNQSGAERQHPAQTADIVTKLDQMSREARINTLLQFSAKQFVKTFCALNRKYRRLYCGAAPLPRDTELVDDKDIIYEHWEGYIERDFGISEDPDLCRGFTPFERNFVARSLQRHIPKENRLNFWLASAYAEFYRQLVTSYATHTTTRFFNIQEVHGNMAFVYSRPLRPEGFVLELTNAVELLAAFKQSPRIMQTLPLFTTASMDNVRVFTTGVGGGTYLILDDFAERAKLVHMYNTHIYASPVFSTQTSDYPVVGVYTDPFDPRRGYAIAYAPAGESIDRVVLYRITAPEYDDRPRNVVHELPLERVATFGSYMQRIDGVTVQTDAPTTLQFERFSLAITPSGLRVISSRGPAQATRIVVPPKLAPLVDWRRAQLFVVPLNERSDDPPRMRLVLVRIQDGDFLNLVATLCVDFIAGTTTPSAAVLHTFKTAKGSVVQYELISRSTIRFTLIRESDYSGPLLDIVLDSGTFTEGESSADYNLFDQNSRWHLFRMRPIYERIVPRTDGDPEIWAYRESKRARRVRTTQLQLE